VAASAAMVVIGRMPYPCLRVGGAITRLDDAPGPPVPASCPIVDPPSFTCRH
jgi:hypothetical protein